MAETASADCTGAPIIDAFANMAISGDGAHLYLMNHSDDPTRSGVLVLSRDGATGGLSLPPAPGGCMVETGGAGCVDGHGLTDMRAIATSPDGRSVYAGSQNNAGKVVAILARNPLGGALSQDPARPAASAPTARADALRSPGWAAGKATWGSRSARTTPSSTSPIPTAAGTTRAW